MNEPHPIETLLRKQAEYERALCLDTWDPNYRYLTDGYLLTPRVQTAILCSVVEQLKNLNRAVDHLQDCFRMNKEVYYSQWPEVEQ